MKFNDIISTANSNLMRNKGRTLLTVLAIFIGSFTIILNVAINTGVNSFIDKQVESVGGEGYLDVAPAAMISQMEAMGSSEPQEYLPEENSSAVQSISEETIKKTEEIPGVTSVDPFRMISAEYITSSNTDKRFKLDIQGMGTDKIHLDIAEGRSPSADNPESEIALLPNFATALGFSSDADAIGKTITLAIKNRATGKLSNIEATVVGIQAPSVISMGRTWISQHLHEEVFKMMNVGVPAEIANLTMALGVDFDPEIASEDEVKQALEEIDLIGLSVADEIGMVKTFFDIILIVFSIFGGIALLAASIGIINTLFMSVQERTREIGLMKAMGLSSAQVFLSFSFEAISLGFWGSALGIGVSILVGSAANSIFHGPGMFLEDFPTFNLVEFTFQNCAIIALIIMFIAFLAGTLPARRAAKQNPIDALRYE